MGKKRQDPLQRAKECYDDLREQWADNRRRMLEDLRFSDPADPQQWDEEALTLRKGRPCLVLDRTNQYIMQVVNSGRMSKPGINCMPADSGADIAVAEALDGIIRHIEYRSRAHIAYDWALEGAARCGVGWIKVGTRVVDPATNMQEIVIDRVADHLSAMVDGDQPDGSDAMNGFLETLIPKKRFKKLYPKASTRSWDAGGDGVWQVGDYVRVAEYQYVEEAEVTMLAIEAPDNGEELHLTAEEYAELVARIGYTPPAREYKGKTRTVYAMTTNGDDILDETIIPGNFIGIVPVIGYESFVDGRRSLCGMTRRLMGPQRAYNYERSAGIEAVALQPKAPVMAPAESMEGHEDHWVAMNTGQPAVLPFNALDQEGRPLPVPQRLAPPSFPQAFAQGGQMAVGDMEAGVGMFQSNLGMANNASSGRQERERKLQGDVASFHYSDNLGRSIEHIGRIVVGMIPTVYDTRRQAKILGLDGQQSAVEIDPQMPMAARKEGKKVVAINPTVGRYDVRVKTGPNYTTQREEAAEGITAILQSAPQLTPLLAPELARMRDWPNSEKIARAMLTQAPPEVRAIMGEDSEQEDQQGVQLMGQVQQMQQQMQQMAAMLDAAEKELQRLEGEAQTKAAEAAAREREALIKAQAEVRKAEIDAAGGVEEARLQAEAQVIAAQTKPVEAVQPAPEAPDPTAVLMPVLLGLQQQIAALQAGGGLEVVQVIHERDPVTGLAVASRPVYGRPTMQ